MKARAEWKTDRAEGKSKSDEGKDLEVDNGKHAKAV